jgi:hypothetical protein
MIEVKQFHYKSFVYCYEDQLYEEGLQHHQ